MESQQQGNVDWATESGDAIWAIDTQIKSTAGIDLLLYEGLFIAQALWLTIGYFRRAMVVGSVGPDRTVEMNFAGHPGTKYNA